MTLGWSWEISYPLLIVVILAVILLLLGLLWCRRVRRQEEQINRMIYKDIALSVFRQPGQYDLEDWGLSP